MISVGFRFKSATLFLGLAGIIGVGLASINSDKGQADMALFSNQSFGNVIRTITIEQNGKVTISNPETNVSQELKGTISQTASGSRFFYKVFDEPDQTVGDALVKVKLPNSVTTSLVKPQAWLIHSIDSRAPYSIVGQREIDFSGSSIGPAAIYTIQIDLPKGAIEFSPISQFFADFSSFSFPIWVAFATAMPFFALIWLVIFLKNQIFHRKPMKFTATAKLPSDTPSAIIGVLNHGKVGGKEIASTLIDLAIRGYISITYNNGNFVMNRPALGNEKGLKMFEKILLSKLFYTKQQKATFEDIQFRIGHRLFSKKIAKVYFELYKEASKLNWFVENPTAVHNRVKARSLMLFALSLTGFIYGVIKAPEPKLFLFFWVGMMGMSLIIYGLTPYLPLRSDRGFIDLAKWLGFREYLADPLPIGYKEAQNDLFSRYLPYAIALDCELEWVSRFREHPFALPAWYQSKTTALEDFTRELFPLINWLGNSLAMSSEPLSD